MRLSSIPLRLSLFLLLCAAMLVAGQEARAVQTIVDAAGQTVTLQAPPRRIIPLYAAMSELLKELGLADRIVGRTASDETLPGTLPVVGTHMRPNFEIVTGLRPDLLIQLEGREEAALAAQRFMELGIPVARFRIASFDDLFSCILRLGTLCGVKEQADAVVAGYKQELEAVQAGIRGSDGTPKIFFEVRYPNLLGAGGGNMLSDIARKAEAANLLEEYPQRLVRLSEEALVAFEPDIYIVLEGPMNKQAQHPAQRPHFAGLKAVRNNRVYVLREEDFSRPGPGSLKAVRELVRIRNEWLENNGS